MLADQFHEAAAGARTTAALDDIARRLWRAHSEGQLSDSDAEAASQAVQARRAVLAGNGPRSYSNTAGGLRRSAKRREKMFGPGRPRALDRNAKVRIKHLARCLSRRTEPGKAYGAVTAKALAVLEALLWVFHNNRSGLCFPSYETIAEAAHCARSTVAEAIRALEDAGVLTWVQRIKRIRERVSDLLGDNGWRWRAIRTSNAYAFNDPGAAERLDFRPESSKSEKPTGTPNQGFSTSRPGGFRPARGRFRSDEATLKDLEMRLNP